MVPSDYKEEFLAKVIRKSYIPKLLNFLGQKYQIFAPIKKGDDFVFDLINPYGITDKFHKVVLNYPTTIMPPTKILLPPKETMYYTENDQILPPPKPQLQILFGVHSYDIAAIELLDKMMTKPQKDQRYIDRRKKTIIIGVGHNQKPYHFHNLLGIKLKTGYDLFLNETKDRYLVTIGSDVGKKLTKLEYFENSDWKIEQKDEERDPLFSPKLAKHLEKEKNHPIWEELAKTCFGCGICSYVCPLCYCTENCQQSNFDGSVTSSCRRRDACFLPSFFQITGTNLKKDLKDRIYFWYHHKFVRSYKEYGQPACVGCGRCIIACPAKINFKKVLEKIAKRK